MVNKFKNSSKTKLFKKLTPSAKLSPSLVSSSLYSGVANAQEAILRSRSPLTLLSKQLKDSYEEVVSFAIEPLPPLVEYHPWQAKYNQVFTREKIIKSMTKDSYTQTTRLIAYANESINTEEECEPLLIPADAVRINKPIIRREPKPILPIIIRYIRSNNPKPTERILPQISTKKPAIPQLQVETKKPTISQLQVETKTILPMIGINKRKKITPNLITTDHSLNQARMRKDGTFIRRAPKKLMMDTIQETISPLSVYG